MFNAKLNLNEHCFFDSDWALSGAITFLNRSQYTAKFEACCNIKVSISLQIANQIKNGGFLNPKLNLLN